MITLHIFARITCLHGNNLGPFGRLSVRNVPCQWSGWCDWTACGATCGAEAVHSRTRECLCDDQIDPSSRGCLGDDHEVEPCGDTECPEEKDEGKFLIKKFEKSEIIVVHTFHMIVETLSKSIRLLIFESIMRCLRSYLRKFLKY